MPTVVVKALDRFGAEGFLKWFGKTDVNIKGGTFTLRAYQVHTGEDLVDLS